jgi:hypothetical protein
MFILDSLMISGIRWALQTTLTAAEAEMNDDTSLRERLLEAEMRREMGEISDEEFRSTEADLLARIREIRERREGTAPLEIGAAPMQTSADSTFTVEAELSGDFHEPVEHLKGSTGGTVTSAGGVSSRKKRTKSPARTAPAPAAKRSRTRTTRAHGTSRTTGTTRTSKA